MHDIVEHRSKLRLTADENITLRTEYQYMVQLFFTMNGKKPTGYFRRRS
jgi:hypothetical protein